MNINRLYNLFSLIIITYVVAEFEQTANDCGGIAVLRQTWLTPLKRESFWPHYKDREKFNAALKKGEEIDEENWKLYPISRIFYETDCFETAIKKCKKAELTSSLESEEEYSRPRKTKRVRRFIDDGSSSEEERFLPKPPKIKFTALNKGGNLINSIKNRSEASTSAINNKKGNTGHGNSCGSAEGSVVNDITDTSSSILIRKNTSESALALTTHNGNTINTEAYKSLLREVLIIKQQNKEILQILKNPKHNGKGILNNLPEDFPVILPINTQEQLDILEEYLGDTIKINPLVSYLSGDFNDSSYATNKILKQLLTDLLASTFSFYGKRQEKKAFANLKLRSVVVAAVCSSCESNEQKVESHVKVWLKHAPQRLKYKK